MFYPKGSPENPLSEHELHAKFEGLAGMVLSKDGAKKLLGAVQDLEQIDDMQEFLELIVSDS